MKIIIPTLGSRGDVQPYITLALVANVPEPIFDACTPQESLIFLSINGSVDPFIPLKGGEVCENVRLGCEGSWVVSQTQSIGKFVASNGCEPDPLLEILPVLEQDGTSVEQQIFPNCQYGALAAFQQVGRGLVECENISRRTQRRASQEVIPVPFFALIKRLTSVRRRVLQVLNDPACWVE